MLRTAWIAGASLALSACSLFDDSDPREGVEPIAECMARLADRDDELAEGAAEATIRPTYTFDVTKLSLAEIEALVKPGSDETAGQRLLRQTNEADTAVELFMSDPVSEDGAFFLGRDPALYRVRGPDMLPEEAVRKGCEMQQANMRLKTIQTDRDPAAETDPETLENETPS